MSLFQGNICLHQHPVTAELQAALGFEDTHLSFSLFVGWPCILGGLVSILFFGCFHSPPHDLLLLEWIWGPWFTASCSELWELFKNNFIYIVCTHSCVCRCPCLFMHVTARGQPEVLHLSFGDRLLSLYLSHEESEAGWLESPEETWLRLPSTEIVCVYRHVWIFLNVDSGGTRLRSFC